MTRDDIIRMAREAGGSTDDPSDLLTIANLERFAALVAAAEREACARVCDEQAESNTLGHAERYRAWFIADAIRTRGEE